MGLSHPIAGWGDVGYHNRWAMEFRADLDFLLVPNMRIGQIVFHQTQNNSGDYTQETGNYQKSIEFVELIKNWCKEDILPKQGNY